MLKYARIILVIILIIPGRNVFTQSKGLKAIRSSNLRATIGFMASDSLQGRKTGDPGIKFAALYIVSEAEKLGLKPVDEKGNYLQPYEMTKTSLIQDSSWLSVIHNGKSWITMRDGLIVTPLPEHDMTIEAPVIFAGYGIDSPEDNYNDLEGLEAKNKIIMVMDRAPSSQDGKKGLLKNNVWMNQANLQAKLPELLSLYPKAVMLVLDPKSGYRSMEDYSSEGMKSFMEDYILTGIESMEDMLKKSMPRIIVISRSMADTILKTCNADLKSLQDKIDSELQPHSMEIPDTRIKIKVKVSKQQVQAFNVAAKMEGSDSELRKEALLYTAHYDHLGIDESGRIYHGADDNASGCAGLIEIAKAFREEKSRIRRSIIFLWISGEELDLMGSKYYTEKPLFPLEKTLADINLDMIGRTKSDKDTGIIGGEKLDVKPGDSVFVAGGKGCAELLNINDRVAKRLHMGVDYAYNSPNDPHGMYYRSDHYSFALKNIPVLFYTTGLHRDYHSTEDLPAKLNYEKIEKVSRLAFLVGFELASRKKKLQCNY